MKKWEYSVQIITSDAVLKWVGGVPGMLNIMGSEGWELVCVAQEDYNPQTELFVSQEFYFKRETDIDFEGRMEIIEREEEMRKTPGPLGKIILLESWNNIPGDPNKGPGLLEFLRRFEEE